jgi:uncharacterized lipoprotein YajG
MLLVTMTTWATFAAAAEALFAACAAVASPLVVYEPVEVVSAVAVEREP